MKKKLVLFITKGNKGGAQKYIFDIYNDKLINKDFDVYIFVGQDGYKNGYFENLQNVFVFDLKNDINPFTLIKNIYEIYKKLKDIKPDVFHYNSSKASMIGVIISKFVKVKSVFTAHGWPHNESHRNLFINKILQMIMILIVFFSDISIAVSNITIKRLISSSFLLSFIQKKFKVIYNGIKINDEKRINNKYDRNNLKIISVGELHPNKGHDIVLNILNKINGIEYHIAGSGYFEKKLNKIIFDNKLQKAKLLGFQNNISKLLENYDIFLMPSRTEALPYAIIEALNAGLPVIAHNVGGISEILKDLPYAILYNDENELFNILNDKDKLISLIENMNKNAWNDKRFDINNMMLELLNVYNSK